MSCNERERGSLLLPTAAASAVKKAVRDAQNAEHEQIYTLAIEFWRGLKSKPRTSKALYTALGAWREAQYAKHSRSLNSYYAVEPSDDAATIEAVCSTLGSALWRNGGREGKPCAPRREDVSPKKVTNKDNVFAAGDEACISFKGREVNWSVSENNHAVETARATPVAKAFFKAIGAVTWTRGTGGVFKYANEYQEDAWQGPTISARYGPLGDQQYAHETGLLLKQVKAMSASRPATRRF